MKILWFTNNPSLAQEFLGSHKFSGGWIYSLEKELKKNSEIELGVAFISKTVQSSFEYNGTTYFPICNKRNNFIYRAILWTSNSNERHSDLDCFLRIVADFNPDIIHIHGTELSFGKIIPHLSIPVVISIQGNLTVYQKMYYRGINKLTTVRIFNLKDFLFLKTFYKDYLRLKKRAKREKEILASCKYIIGRTDWDRRITRVLSPKSIYYHNDEILRDLFYTEKWNYTSTDELKIYSITGSPLYKGFETICEAAYLLETKIGINFEWAIAGLNEDDNIVKLCKKIMRNRYPSNRIKLLGQLEENLLIEGIKYADIYISASHIENSPNSLCEALMLGIPSIATFAGGTSSILQENKEGLMVQDGDAIALAGAIIELKNDPNKAKYYGQKARIKAITRHDRVKIATETFNIYKEIINNYCQK